MSDSNKKESFADMLDASFKGPQRLEPGQQVDAQVASVGKEWVFLDLGGKSEGYIAKKELEDKQGNLTVQPGDTITAYFLSAQKNGMLFTTTLSGGPAALAHLEDAHRNRIPVEGFVVKETKGGFEVKIGGAVRAFCPYSQIDIRRAESPEEYIGQHLSFQITEYREGGRNIVLSRRAVLEEERNQKKEALRETLKVGDVVKGTITSVRDFGAFVDIGGIEGLIPISEIGWGTVDDVHALLEAGQEVEVATLKLDWDKDRFSFSLKETLPDPWEEVLKKYPAGSTHLGKIVRLMNFGAFVALEPGVDGLLHISQLAGGRKINHPREVVQQDQEVEVRIESINPEEKRISLALAAVEQQSTGQNEESQVDYKEYLTKKAKAAPKGMGTLGDLLQKQLDKQKKK